MSDASLLELWYKDRGSRADRLSKAQEDALIPALRARYEAMLNPLQKKFCTLCGIAIRGEHREVRV